MPSLLEVRTTFGSVDDAKTVGRKLVFEKLIACAQVIPNITSIYRWEGEIKSDNEVLVLLKTTTDAWPTLRDRLAELHPYDTPEILAVPVEVSCFNYASWVKENTKGG